MMQPLNLPPYPFRLKKTKGRMELFDPIRQKWLVLTPEEWVRQHIAMYLVEHRGYAKGRMGIEQGLKLAGSTRRTDLVTFDAEGKPFLLVECKAPSIKLNQAVLDQALHYNHTLGLHYVAITNGLDHYIYHIDASGVTPLDDFPLSS